MSARDAVAVAGPPEPAFPIRLIALDLDGTLIDDDLELRDRTIAAIQGAISRGVSVSIVTGRMTTSAIRFARRLGITDPIVGYQGAIIRDVEPPESGRLGKLLLHRPLEPAMAREAIEYARSIGLSPHVNHLERFIIQSDDPGADDYSAFLGGRALLTDDLVGWVRRPVSKVICVSETPIDHGVLDAARARFAGRAEVTVSHPRFLEFLRTGVSKGAAVAWLARRAGGAAVGSARDRRPVQRSRDDRGRRARRGDAPRSGAGARGRAVRRPAARRGRSCATDRAARARGPPLG